MQLHYQLSPTHTKDNHYIDNYNDNYISTNTRQLF